MGVSVDTGGGGGRKSVDVDINLVPFIDMMSVLVAFLLLTAAWTNLAQINIKPGGLGAEAEKLEVPPVNLSVLVAEDGIWLGLTTDAQPQRIDKLGEEQDFNRLAEELKNYKEKSGHFTERDDLELAAEDKITYQTVITAMDKAIGQGFTGLKFVDPGSLSVQFKAQ